MKYLIVPVGVLLFSCNAIAETPVEISRQAICGQFEISGLNNDQLAQRGCCSHHGGVCGCAGLNLRCCDGVTSPSCGCHSIDPINPTFVPDEGMPPKS